MELYNNVLASGYRLELVDINNVESESYCDGIDVQGINDSTRVLGCPFCFLDPVLCGVVNVHKCHPT